MTRTTIEEIQSFVPTFTGPKQLFEYPEPEIETTKWGTFKTIAFWLWFTPHHKDGSGTCMVGMKIIRVEPS